jgi:hypothetical protein
VKPVIDDDGDTDKLTTPQESRQPVIEDDEGTEGANPQESGEDDEGTEVATPHESGPDSSSSDSKVEIEASGATMLETAVAVTPNSICENPEGSENGEENDPFNTEELETIEQLKQVKKINNNNSSW